MAANFGTILSNAVDRLLSKGSAIVYFLEFGVNLLLTVGIATLFVGSFQMQEVQTEEKAAADSAFVDSFPLAIEALPASIGGLMAIVSLTVWVGVMIVAFRTFAQESGASIGPLDGFGWAFLNLIAALILYGILSLLGLLALLVGFLVVTFLLFYYFPAVVIGRENAFGGLKQSVSFATGSVGTTAILWVLFVGIFIAYGIGSSILGFVLPSIVSDLVNTVFISAIYVAYYAVASQAYVAISQER